MAPDTDDQPGSASDCPMVREGIEDLPDIVEALESERELAAPVPQEEPITVGGPGELDLVMEDGWRPHHLWPQHHNPCLRPGIGTLFRKVLAGDIEEWQAILVPSEDLPPC